MWLWQQAKRRMAHRVGDAPFFLVLLLRQGTSVGLLIPDARSVLRVGASRSGHAAPMLGCEEPVQEIRPWDWNALWLLQVGSVHRERRSIRFQDSRVPPGFHSELHMSALRDAFSRGRQRASNRPAAAEGHEGAHIASAFHDGVEWVRGVLVPAIDDANAELEAEHIAFRLDLNLDPRSTNHAHADLWLSESGDGQRRHGPKYSINVISGSVWLYKAGAPGRILGSPEQCGPHEIESLLRDATEEFGRILG